MDKITMEKMTEILKECIEDFEKKGMPIGNDVEIEFMPLDVFEEGLKQDFLLKILYDRGIITNTVEQSPSFMVVLYKNKEKVRKLFGLPYVISICKEIAEYKFRNYGDPMIRTYMRHAFCHELAHIVEDQLIESNHELWKKALEESQGIEHSAKEFMAEDVASLFVSRKKISKMDEEINGDIMKKIKMLTK